MPRYRYLTFCLAVTLAVFFTSQSHAQQLDILLRGGSVVDGTGSPAKIEDIGIQGDRIVYIGTAHRPAKRVIDATGLVVTPGFIDPHTHTAEDLSDPKTSRNDAYLMQGVTTVATANDGSGPFPIGATLDRWTQQGIGTNAVLFVGQGTVRSRVMGMSDAKPTAAQIEQMKALVKQGMEDGAIGLSTGLYYAPGSYSSTEEVIELAKVASAYGGIYDTHMRDEGSYNIGLQKSVEETVRIGREAHLPVMISHIKALGTEVWGQSKDVIAIIDKARAEGVNVTASQYPYTASGTSVEASLLPRWAEVDGREAMLKRFDDPTQQQRLRIDMQRNLVIRGGADKLLMTSSHDKSIVGKTLAQIATERNQDPITAAIAIMKAGGAGVASFNMNQGDIDAFMRQPWMMTCSDGSTGHPRKYGTFPTKIHDYVYERRFIPLEFAVRSSTSLTAETLGLHERGTLKQGYFADVLVFDPKTFRAQATYEQPTLLATGVRFLFVNGTLAVEDGKLTEAHAGRVLKHEKPQAK